MKGMSKTMTTIVYIIVYAGVLAGMWKISEKIGDPGWYGLIPLFAQYRLFLRTRPDQAVIFTILTFFLVGYVVYLLDLAKSFGKSTGWAVLTFFVGFVTLPLLGFGEEPYLGPALVETV